MKYPWVTETDPTYVQTTTDRLADGEMYIWLRTNCRNAYYVAARYEKDISYAFENAEDATAFKLRFDL